MDILGIDIGGSGIKAAIVNAATGEPVTERLRSPSPPAFQPDEVAAVVADLVKQFNYSGPIGVGFPAVVMHGVVITPPTALAFPGWAGVNLADKLSAATGRPVTVGNDADVACLAEMYFGAGKGRSGLVMVFTIGTGIGSAVFYDGHIIPNSELGRLYLRGRKKTIEQLASDRIREQEKLSWKEWGERLNDYFQYVELLFWPDTIIVGGGVSKKYEKFFPYINVRAELLPAAFRNEAGIVGAAMAALDAHDPQPWELSGAGHSSEGTE